MNEPTKPAEDLANFPLLSALLGRRARRFGLGMEVPSGPLKFRSDKDPIPLSGFEHWTLVAAATGVSGWSFGVPYGPRTPDSHAEFTLRFTGRTSPTAAGLGTPALFYTNDAGCHVTLTRDIQPGPKIDDDGNANPLGSLLEVCRAATSTLKEARLDLPSSPPHILPPNLWWANRPGSTLFMPVGDASEVCLGILALMMRHGVMPVDQDTGLPAGNLMPFVRSGLLDEEKAYPLSELMTDVNDSLCLELAFMGHNIVLMLQAIGLGGLYFNGMDGLSALGAYAGEGVTGLGFTFVADDRWVTPNPVGLPGVYEALCPPNYPDMRSAVEVFVARKFGKGGAYDPELPGPWREPASVRRSVLPYEPEFIECLVEVATYMYEKYGKFPGTRSTIMLPGFVQAHHLDTDFYDTHYETGSYLETHFRHFETWHAGG